MRWLTNVRLPAMPGLWRIVVDADDCIRELEVLPSGSAAAGENWQGDWLSPMGVDLQINGGLGLAFTELRSADLPRLAELQRLLWSDGVEAICPTLVTCGIAPLQQALEVLAEARQRTGPQQCHLLGAHLEGPFLAHERRGAHPAQHLATPSVAALQERIGGFEADIALMTLAPELQGASEVITALKSLRVVASLGHSAATEEQAAEAFAHGLGMVTHAFNAMGGLQHRNPGPLAAALRRGDVALGLIADGVHVAPSMAVLLLQWAPEQVVLVSDALAPYGLADGEHRWDERLLIVADGSCRLEDGTLAGVTLPLLAGVSRLAGWGADPGRAIAAATVLPRRVLGDQRSPETLLLDQPLGAALRWRQGSKGLAWQWAT
jgi:N-acetylglucosamine-6-phosphate deacetylase